MNRALGAKCRKGPKARCRTEKGASEVGAKYPVIQTPRKGTCVFHERKYLSKRYIYCGDFLLFKRSS